MYGSDPYSMYRGSMYGGESQYGYQSRYSGAVGAGSRPGRALSPQPQRSTPSTTLSTGGPGGPSALRSPRGGQPLPTLGGFPDVSAPNTSAPRSIANPTASSYGAGAGVAGASGYNYSQASSYTAPPYPSQASSYTSLQHTGYGAQATPNANTSRYDINQQPSYSQNTSYTQQAPAVGSNVPSVPRGAGVSLPPPRPAVTKDKDLSKDAIMKVFQQAVADENYYTSAQEMSQWKPHTSNFVKQLFNDINVYDQHYAALPPRERFNKLLHARNADWPERNYLQRTAIRFLTYVLEEFDKQR